MGEMMYTTNHGNAVAFYDDPKLRYACLCTFPFGYSNHRLDEDTVASLALLGAAIAIDANTNGLDRNANCYRNEYSLPECVDEWVRDEIRRVLYMLPEKLELDESESMTEYAEPEYKIDSLKAAKKKFRQINKWSYKELKKCIKELRAIEQTRKR